MASINRVILAGNLTRDPEVRYLPSGSAVAEFGLAINDHYRDRENKLVERTCFVDIVVWGKQAETCGEYLSKGAPILLEGRLQFDQWENQQGEKRSRLRVKADRVQFLGSPRRGEFSGGRRDESPREEAPRASAPPAETPGDNDDLPF